MPNKSAPIEDSGAFIPSFSNHQAGSVNFPFGSRRKFLICKVPKCPPGHRLAQKKAQNRLPLTVSGIVAVLESLALSAARVPCRSHRMDFLRHSLASPYRREELKRQCENYSGS
jgi:hypothetical protein